MQFQAYNRILLCKDPLENIFVAGRAYGYQFRIRYPSYRGTFLSCIEQLEFYIDGEKIESSAIRFCINNKEFLLTQLPDQYKEYWFILDKATIIVLRDGGIPQGNHTIRVVMRHRIPYAGYGGSYLSLPSDITEIRSTAGGN